MQSVYRLRSKRASLKKRVHKIKWLTEVGPESKGAGSEGLALELLINSIGLPWANHSERLYFVIIDIIMALFSYS